MTDTIRSRKSEHRDKISTPDSNGRQANEESCSSSDDDETEFVSGIHNATSNNFDESKPVQLQNGHQSKSSSNSQMLNSTTDEAPLRLLVVSSRIKNSSVMQSAVLPHVVFFQYKYESSTVHSCLAGISQQLNNRRVESMAFVLHCSQASIHLTGKDEKVLNKDVLLDRPQYEAIRDFFRLLVTTHMKSRDTIGARIDILSCNFVQSDEAEPIARNLQTVVMIPVYIHKDIMGSELRSDTSNAQLKPTCVGDLYFRADKMRMWSGRNQTLAGFEKIHTVGKGAYGTAVLYKKKDDDSLVILKEINLHDLNVAERQLAQNEICVLAMLDHPNIIGYYDSFEEDGILMIEMEYADGGTLAQYLAQRDKPLEEKEILEIFSQIAQAIKHIHQHNILHRDLKTANIFLTKEGYVKLGDFGISKLMTSVNGGANTVLGTPYYISPEMCEGKPYKDKSDIWAMGCILYEMACLQKTFEGSNLPALVNKIMKGQFAPVKGNYSEEFKTLIMDMLRQEPESRPSAVDLCNTRLPQLMHCYERMAGDARVENDHVSEYKTRRGVQANHKHNKSRSVLYYFRMSNLQLIPVELPSKVKLEQVSIGNDHVLVVTVERMVYSWGDGSKGQLGHGNLESKLKPCMVDTLKGKSIIKVCCGDGFSVFGSDNGLVLTCGDGSTGCLGHGDWSDISRPRLIEALLSVDVTSLTTGPLHVLAVGSEGDVFSWGQGSHGRLGLGTEENHCQPMEVTLPECDIIVRECRAGCDGSVLITDVGSVLACGNNEHNKLGLNQRQGFLMTMKNMFNKCEVSEMKTFTVVRVLARHRVLDVSLGAQHTCVLIEPGQVLTLGRNSEGQLGSGNTKQQAAPINVKVFQQRPAARVQSGNHYSVAASVDGELLFWGLRCTVDCCNSVLVRGSYDMNNSDEQTAVGSACSASSNCHTNSRSEVSGSGHPKDDSQVILQPMPLLRSCLIFRKVEAMCRILHYTWSHKIYEFVGVACRRLDSPGTSTHASHSSAPLTVALLSFFTHGDNLFLQVETTAPPPRRSFRRKKKVPARRRLPDHLPDDKNLSVSSHDGGDEYSSEASELDGTKHVPPWLQRELVQHSEIEPPSDGNEADGTSEHSDNDEVLLSTVESAVSSIRINTDLLKQANGFSAAQLRLQEDQQSEGNEPAKTEAGHQLLSSSGSSGVLHVVEHHVNVPKKLPATVQKRTFSAVTKTSSQLPVARTRTHSRKRPETANGQRVIEDDIKNRQHGLDLLQLEMENLRLEKRKTEERLQRMEEEQRKQSERLALEAARQSAEKEKLLMHEVISLRQELQQQSSQLKNNQQVIESLQDQLSRVQKEQQRLVVTEQHQETPRKQNQRESRICIVQ